MGAREALKLNVAFLALCLPGESTSGTSTHVADCVRYTRSCGRNLAAPSLAVSGSKSQSWGKLAKYVSNRSRASLRATLNDRLRRLRPLTSETVGASPTTAGARQRTRSTQK